MEKLKEKLWAELDEIAKKKDLSAGDLEMAHKLTDTIKNIDKICMLEEGGHSQDGGMGYSQANRGQHYVRGHYSRDRQGGGSYEGGNSYRGGRGGHSRDGYSQGGDRSEMIEHLEMAMDVADEQDRETIKRFIRKVGNA